MTTNYEVREENAVLTNSCLMKFRTTINDHKVVMVFAEFLGTAALVFFGCMGVIDWMGMPGLPIQASLSFGLTVAFVVQTFGHISYAIINPSIVILAIINELIDIKLGFFIAIAEVFGAAIGYGLLVFVTPTEFLTLPSGERNGMCMTLPHPAMSSVQAFIVEFFLTAALTFVVSAVWDPRNRDLGDSVPLKIGFTVAVLSFSGRDGTGASMNPARSFGPALWNWNWDHHWIYWSAPLISSFLAGTLYRSVFWRRHPKDLIAQPQVEAVQVEINGENK